MAFENVNVSSLRSALDTAKNDLVNSDQESLNLITTLADNGNWQANAKGTLKEALEKLTGERYVELRDKIDSYYQIVDYITEYKDLEKANNDLRNSLTSLNNRLWVDEETEVDGETFTTQVIDHNVQNQINIANDTLTANLNRMDELVTLVANAI